MKHINQLPRDCFLIIVGRFPLYRQLQLRAVCRHWCAQVEETCRQKSSLKLFGSQLDQMEYCMMLVILGVHVDATYRDGYIFAPVGSGRDDDLVTMYDDMEDPDVGIGSHFLPKLFANVTKLTLVYDDLNSIDVSFLLANFKLTWLTIYHGTALPMAVMRAINSITSLKSLNLIANKERPKVKFPKIKFPILSQLEHLTFGGYRCDVVHVLRQLGPNIKHLIVNDVIMTGADWNRLFACKPELGRLLTHLHVNHTDPNTGPYSVPVTHPELLPLVCTMLPSLTYLNLTDFLSIPLEDMITQLAKLPNLTEVYIQPSGRWQKHASLIAEVDRLPRLESVKILHVHADNFSPELFAQFFPPLFPNVEHLLVLGDTLTFGQQLKKQVYGQFPKLKRFQYDSHTFAERSLEFTGRHSEAYRDYMDERIRVCNIQQAQLAARRMPPPPMSMEDLNDLVFENLLRHCGVIE